MKRFQSIPEDSAVLSLPCNVYRCALPTHANAMHAARGVPEIQARGSTRVHTLPTAGGRAQGGTQVAPDRSNLKGGGVGKVSESQHAEVSSDSQQQSIGVSWEREAFVPQDEGDR